MDWDIKAYAKLITFSSWDQWDNGILRQKLTKAQSDYEILKNERERDQREIKRLFEIIKNLGNDVKQIWEINNDGGAGSRRKVSKIAAVWIEICESCGHAICVCKK